jgi:hypothetical protein
MLTTVSDLDLRLIRVFPSIVDDRRSRGFEP